MIKDWNFDKKKKSSKGDKVIIDIKKPLIMDEKSKKEKKGKRTKCD